jgi:murein DD-endopeptidase MepM/ murein hydrolase activator NlpD
VKFLSVAAAIGILGCGGDGSPASGGTGPTGGAKHISFGADTVVLQPGTSQRISPSLNGSAINAASLTFEIANNLVLQISADGVFQALAPGTTLVTASDGAATGSVVVRVADHVKLGTFISPLAQSVTVVSVFDHDLPFEFSDNNGYLLSFWGEKLSGIDGHNGYDWLVPVGTPIRASADGVVVFAQNETPFVCPLLNNATVSGLWIMVAHGLDNGDAVDTEYGHLSRIDVTYGQRVVAGQQLGLSGTTGCSTLPHLHFSAFRGSPATQQPIVMDPYGWQASTADIWANDSRGTTSVALWTGANVPPLYRELTLPDAAAFTVPSPVVITKVRIMGVDDDHNPNNEYVDVTANPNVGPTADLSGITLNNVNGDTFTFPDGIVLSAGSSIRVFSGSGTNSASTLYWNRTKPAWNNIADCAELYTRGGTYLFNAFWVSTKCLRFSAAADRTAMPTVRALDAQSPFANQRSGIRLPR